MVTEFYRSIIILKHIITYIQSFLNRSGSYVLLATILSRVLSFFASWIALQYIDNYKLGVILFAWNVITFLLPLVGLGLPQSLIRFGALANKEDKDTILRYVVKYGTYSSILLSILVSFVTFLYPFEFDNTGIYIAFLSIILTPFFWFETIKIKLRLEHNNKSFAFVDIIYNSLLCFLVFILSYLFTEIGYVIALVLSPTLTSLLFFKHLKTEKRKLKKLKLFNFEFWKYGFFGGMANVVTMLLFAIDLLLIGTMLNDAALVTAYRYISIIPFSILFLPRVFIATDYVMFTENLHKKDLIFQYIKSYISLFIVISSITLVFSYFFGKEILSIFDNSFIVYFDSFIILNIGVCGILILRGLFGNLLSSIGWVKTNFFITTIALIINYFANQYLIVRYGIKGAAITSALLMWITGIASAIIFFIGYKKQRTNV